MRFLLEMSRWFVLLALAAVVYVLGGFAWSYCIADRAPRNAPMGEQIGKDEDVYTAQIVGSAIDLSMISRKKLLDASTDEKQRQAWQRQVHLQGSSSAGPNLNPSDVPDTALDAKGNRITDSQKAPGFSTSAYRRDVHAKSHGCIYSTFQVQDDVPSQLAFGVFSHPGATYRAIVRFSSGKPQLNSDGVPDARGFAVKLLMDADGFPAPPEKGLLDVVKDEQAREIAQEQQQRQSSGGNDKTSPPPPETRTQDFVMINSKVFFIRTIQEYAAFSKALGEGGPMSYFIPSLLKPWTWHTREVSLATSSFKPRPDSLVTEQYYSLSAYKLGPREYVKFSVRPCPANRPKRPAYASKPGFFSLLWRDVRLPFARVGEFSLDSDAYRDYLRDELSNQLKSGSPCFDFLIQPQIPEKNMPIEDTTVEWNEKASPFIPVGRLTLNQVADNNTAEMNGVCENLSFNPWHALPEQEPVGVMNRIRKAVYQGMSRYRRDKNCSKPGAMACTDTPAPINATAAALNQEPAQLQNPQTVR